MLQFYFLSILLNLLSGLILVYGTDFYRRTSAVLSEGDSSDDFEENEEDEDSTEEIDDASSDTGTSSFAQHNAIFDDSTFRLIVGILGFMVAVLKICSPIQTDTKIVGDLLPAIAGLFSSLILLLEFFNLKSTTRLSLPPAFEMIICEGRKYIGIFCILIAIIHFVCPKILFL